MELFFCIFAGLLVLSSVGVVASKNSVHSVLWLIFAFCNAAGLFILLNAEFLAMALIIVYVGAVAVLFLFVVMMLGNKFFNALKDRFLKKNIILGVTVLALFVFDIALVVLASTKTAAPLQGYYPGNVGATNTHAIGNILYTDFILPFQLSGIVLFTAMIGSIVLTLDSNTRRKHQNVSAQLARTKEKGVKVVTVSSHKGLKGIQYD